MSEYYDGLFTGFVTAVVLMISIFAHFFLRWGDQPVPRIEITLSGREKDVEDIHHGQEGQAEETLNWLNAILKRLVQDATSFDRTRTVIVSRLESLLNSRLPADFVEPLQILDLRLGKSPVFPFIRSTGMGNNYTLAFDWSGSEDSSEVFMIRVLTAVGYTSYVVLPVDISFTLDSIKGNLQIVMHSHYLTIGLDSDFQLMFKISSELGAAVKLKDTQALNAYIESQLRSFIRDRLINDKIVIPYAAISSIIIPRALSPPISPIPPEELFVSVDDLVRSSS